MDIKALKQQAAERAVDYVKSDMIVGLGTGSTAIHAVRKIGRLLADGTLKNIVGIPTSTRTKEVAEEFSIPIGTLNEYPTVHLTIDGADEVDAELNLIKGGGGALLREKIVARASREMIVVVDESKLSEYLGTSWAVPVEVIPFGWRIQQDYITGIGAEVKLRMDDTGAPYKTDNDNFILDCKFGKITDPTALATRLRESTGIVEHGLFIRLAHRVVVAGQDGIRELTR